MLKRETKAWLQMTSFLFASLRQLISPASLQLDLLGFGAEDEDEDACDNCLETVSGVGKAINQVYNTLAAFKISYY